MHSFKIAHSLTADLDEVFLLALFHSSQLLLCGLQH